MLKSSSAKAAAVVFAAGAVYASVRFATALGDREIRSGQFTLALVCAITAFGLFRARRWGRSVGLVVAMGNFGVGTLAVLSVLMQREGPLLGPCILLGAGLAMSYWLSRLDTT